MKLFWPDEEDQYNRSQKPAQRVDRWSEGRFAGSDCRPRAPGRTPRTGDERACVLRRSAVRTDPRWHRAAGPRRAARRAVHRSAAPPKRRRFGGRGPDRGTPRGTVKFWDASAIVPLLIAEVW